MSKRRPLTRYLPIAVVLVAVAYALVATNPEIITGIINPAGVVERSQQREMSAIATRETPLTVAEAFDLWEQYERDMSSRADLALLGQDQMHGLPSEFIEHVETTFIADPSHTRAQSLLVRMARHRPLGVEIEAAFARAAEDTAGYGQAMTALAEIGKQRPLSENSLRALLRLANSQDTGGSVALETIIASAAHGLPGWATDDLARIAQTRRAGNRSKAIQAIATAGLTDRALELINEGTPSRSHASAIATALEGLSVDELLEHMTSESHAIEIRVGALDLIVKRRDQSEAVGRTLTYAFNSGGALREKAYSTYSSYGRHHARNIDVDWPAMIARDLDGDDRLRSAIAGTFQFIPFESRAASDAFILEMLDGSPRQQRNVLLVMGTLSNRSDAVVARVDALQTSSDPELAATALRHIERITPPSTAETATEIATGFLFWLTFAMPVVAAGGWQIIFTAKMVRQFALRSGRGAAAGVALVWFAVCLGLAALLFIGLLGLGHGGNIGFGVFAILAVMGAGIGLLGYLLNMLLRRITPTRPDHA